MMKKKIKIDDAPIPKTLKVKSKGAPNGLEIKVMPIPIPERITAIAAAAGNKICNAGFKLYLSSNIPPIIKITEPAKIPK